MLCELSDPPLSSIAPNSERIGYEAAALLDRMMYGQKILPHQTGANKNHPLYGVNSIADLFRQGRIRIPWGDIEARNVCSPLIDEVTRYPDFDTTDLVMSTWFSRLAIASNYTPRQRDPYMFPRPTWMGQQYQRGIA